MACVVWPNRRYFYITVPITLTTTEALAEFLEYLANLIRQGFVDRVSMEAPLSDKQVGTRVCVVFTTILIPGMETFAEAARDENFETDGEDPPTDPGKSKSETPDG